MGPGCGPGIDGRYVRRERTHSTPKSKPARPRPQRIMISSVLIPGSYYEPGLASTPAKVN